MRTTSSIHTRYWLLLVAITISLSLDALTQQQEPTPKLAVATSQSLRPKVSAPIPPQTAVRYNSGQEF